MSLKLLGINGSVTKNSRTGVVVHTVLDAAAEAYPEIETELLDLGQYDIVFCDGRDPCDYMGDTKIVIEKVVAADALIVGTPVYRASYTGALKNLCDLIPNDALTGKAVGLVATGGSDHHLLALEYALRPVISFFRAHTVPGTVYAQNQHFDAGKRLVAPDVIARAEKLGRDTVELAYRLKGAAGEQLAGPPPPEIKRKAVVEREAAG